MIKTVAVLGAGTMGHAIANNFASHGIKVNLYEAYDSVRATVWQRIEAELKIMIEEAYFDEGVLERTKSNITLYSDLKEAVQEADFVMESAPEILEVKQDIFKQVDLYCKEEAILASNTSSLRMGDIALHLSEKRKSKMMIAHCYNPAHLIPIIELSYFGNMSEEDYMQVKELFESCEKVPVKILKDCPGMVANRLLHAQARECFHIIDEGIASAEDVDKALMFGPCFRNATTGMLECADMGGLDIWYAAEANLFPALDTSSVPSKSMGDLVSAGHYGLKTGQGFYSYGEDEKNAKLDAFNRRLITQLKACRSYKK